MRVENLIMRGHTYYWRARLPARFCGFSFKGLRSVTHICPSLQTTDRDVAVDVARALTLVRDELALNGVGDATADQINCIFAKDRDKMHRRIAMNRIIISEPGVRCADADTFCAASVSGSIVAPATFGAPSTLEGRRGMSQSIKLFWFLSMLGLLKS